MPSKGNQLVIANWLISFPNASNEQLFFSSLYPGDLIPFVRKPLFLIVDSDNSWVFQSVPQLFGQPLVVLMSPQDVPSQYQGCEVKLDRTCLCYNRSLFLWQIYTQKEASWLSFYTVLSLPYASLGKSKKFLIICGRRAKHLSIDFWQRPVVS